MMQSNLEKKEQVNWKEEQIWTYKELAQFLKKSPATIKSERSREPENFPPTLPTSKSPRWVKDLVIEFYKKKSGENGKIEKEKVLRNNKARKGRPRKIQSSFLANSVALG